jgi:tetratricopeptide (TPR) repeat protein
VVDEDAAQRAHDRAGELIDKRRFRDAVDPAAEACRLRPDWAAAWWNYGVALKHAHRWADCLAACDRAIAIAPDDSGGACWNAGIAATALGDWARARTAWSTYGIEVPAGEGPLEMDIGHAGVRVSPEDKPEVVFCERLDPCRARVLSVPLPESDRRFGDIVLHDGEARGKRRFGNGHISVFDELMLLERSGYGTWKVQATCSSAEVRDELLELFDDVDGAIEDWSENIEMLCAQCSLGEPHEHHDVDEQWRMEREFGLALRDESDLGRLRRVGRWWRCGVRDVTRVL